MDFDKRFPKTTIAETLEKMKTQDRWVFQDLIHSSITMLYGRAGVGKSYVVSDLILSLLVRDRPFMGQQPTNPNKEWHPVILGTDPGTADEYALRLHAGAELANASPIEVPLYFIGRTAQAPEWDALASRLMDEGYNFVVLDNLMGATGDTNDAVAQTTVFDGLTRFTNVGIPVLVVHHESQHGGKASPGAPPMGLSTSVQKSRTWIQARQSERKAHRGGNLVLYVQSNALDQPYEITAEPRGTGDAPDYRVVNRAKIEPRIPEQRAPEVLDRNDQVASYIVDHCTRLSQRQAAEKVAEIFGGSKGTWRNSISSGALSKMVKLGADGWERVAPKIN